jgi:hypothetical protein
MINDPKGNVGHGSQSNRQAMRTPLFTEGDASEPAYRNIRDAKDGPLKAERLHCEYLWIFYQHHADKEFCNEIRSNFDARYWEMYLTTSLILAGFEVTCPKPGPDVGIIHKGQRIWFEATSPTRGTDGSPDQIPEEHVAGPHDPVVFQDVPNEKIILRYLNSISVKYNEQYANWLKKGIVSEKRARAICWFSPFPRTVLASLKLSFWSLDFASQDSRSTRLRSKIAPAWGFE